MGAHSKKQRWSGLRRGFTSSIPGPTGSLDLPFAVTAHEIGTNVGAPAGAARVEGIGCCRKPCYVLGDAGRSRSRLARNSSRLSRDDARRVRSTANSRIAAVASRHRDFLCRIARAPGCTRSPSCWTRAGNLRFAASGSASAALYRCDLTVTYTGTHGSDAPTRTSSRCATFCDEYILGSAISNAKTHRLPSVGAWECESTSKSANSPCDEKASTQSASR